MPNPIDMCIIYTLRDDRRSYIVHFCHITCYDNALSVLDITKLGNFRTKVQYFDEYSIFDEFFSEFSAICYSNIYKLDNFPGIFI